MWIKLWNTDITGIKIWNQEVTKVFVGSEQVRPSGWLPTEYQEVEYIQSSWTQCIKLWNQFKTDYKAVIDLQMTATWGDQVPLWIVTSANRFWINAYASYFKVITWWGGWSNTIVEDTNRHTIILNKGEAIVDWVSYSSLYTNVTFNDWIWVFAHYHPETVEFKYYSSNKLYKLDIYDENNEHIYDLVPCYRKLDNVIWLYDLVNDQFYTNSWTWTFTKWPDV
jgi:hypothetical protein